VWAPEGFFLAQIGTAEEPLFLELRFEEASPGIWIALLMTNERVPRDLTAISARIIAETRRRGIAFEAVIGVDALGARLSQEIARQSGEYTLSTTFQKGKPHLRDGALEVGPPKEWVREEDSVPVSSGTSAFARQALFLDHKIAGALGQAPVLIVDDSRLTSGTVNASIALARKMGLNIAAVTTVMNEADPTDVVEGVPYVSLVKIPIFHRDEAGLHPTEGSFEGVRWFYQEIER
jgi:adenine/guanine phosphoribosyltransferase-like PRPP-binding protein